MTDIVNLNQFRKKKKRADDEKRAEENRVKFGRTKAEKVRDAAERRKSDDHLDGSKLDDAK